MAPFGLVEPNAARGHGLTRRVLLTLPEGERLTGGAELLVQLLAVGRGALAVGGDASTERFALGRLELGPLAARFGVSLALLGHSHLTANLLHLLALRRHETKQLGALRVGHDAPIWVHRRHPSATGAPHAPREGASEGRKKEEGEGEVRKERRM